MTQVNVAELAPGTVYARAIYRVTRDTWLVVRHRLRPDGKGVQEQMSETALTACGAKWAAKKMYKRWLREHKSKTQEKVFVFGVHLD